MKHYYNEGIEITKRSRPINKMTEEDLKYRQGRSKRQREAQYKFMEFIGAVVVIMVFVFLMYKILKFIYG